MRFIHSAAAIAAIFCATSSQALGQTPPTAPVYFPTSLAAEADVPRTRDGRPDLQNVVWETPFFAGLTSIPLITPADLTITEEQSQRSFSQFLTLMSSNPAIKLDPEALDLFKGLRGFPIVRGERRSRLLVLPASGRLPLAPDALAELNAAAAAFAGTGKSDNPEDRMLSERCLSQGAIPPMMFMSPLHPRAFVVTPNHVAIHVEYGDEVRIIRISAEHTPEGSGPPMGDSIARWEGDTLVIETTQSPANQRVRASPFGSGLIVNPGATVIERYTRVSRDELIYQFTIEDSAVYTEPWLAEYSLYPASYRMFPSSCHEHNYGLENILSGAREEEKALAQRLASFDIRESTDEPDARWTLSFSTAADVRWWAVLSEQTETGAAQVGLRIERLTPAGAESGLSEINVFEVDCTGRRLRRISSATFAGHNLTGERRELPPIDWAPASNRPAIAEGVRRVCAD